MSDLKNVGNCVKCRVSVLINVHVVVEVAVFVGGGRWDDKVPGDA